LFFHKSSSGNHWQQSECQEERSWLAKKLPAKAAYSKIRLSNLRQKKAYVIGDDPAEFVY